MTSPKHYTEGSMETQDKILAVIEGLPPRDAWCLGNIVKYIDRAGLKDDAKADLKKANDYAHYLVYGSWRED